MSRILSIQEEASGKELVASIANKLHGQIVKTMSYDDRFSYGEDLTNAIVKYSDETNTALMPQLDKLNNLYEIVGDVLILYSYYGLTHIELYDVAEVAAIVEFSYLIDIVYGDDVNANRYYYKYNNEIESYFNITSDILELTLDEDPNNFYDVEVRRSVENMS